MLQTLLPDKQKPEQIAQNVNDIAALLYWISPVINPNAGKVEPHAQYMREGMIAYADGTNWNPDSGGKGLYLYINSTWVKVSHPDNTDPHTIYQKESEKNAANGYLGLDGSKFINLTGVDASHLSCILRTHSSTNWHGSFFGFWRARNTEASPQALVSGDSIGFLDIWGHDGDEFKRCGQLQFFVDGTVSNNIIPVSMSISLMDSTGNLNEVFKMTHTKVLYINGQVTETQDHKGAASGYAGLNASSILDAKVLGTRSTTWESGTSYQAATDILVTANVNADDDLDKGDVEGFTDANNPPTTSVAKASAHVKSGYTSMQFNSITFAVKRGEYWKVVATSGYGTCLFSVNWIPIGA